MTYEVIAWQHTSSEWEARVVDGVSRSWIALGHGPTREAAVAAAVAAYERELVRPPVVESRTITPTPSGARRRLEDNGTSAKRAKRRREPPEVTFVPQAPKRRSELPPELTGGEAWWSDLETVWRRGVEPEVKRLESRRRALVRRGVTLAGRLARRIKERDEFGGGVPPAVTAVWAERAAQRRAQWSRSAKWARDRARSMAMPRAALLNACGTRERMVRCGCGTRWVPVGCGQSHLCPRCNKTTWRKWRRKIGKSLKAHVRSAAATWRQIPTRMRTGKLPGVYFVTLTGPHDGGVRAQRERLAKAWRTLSKIARAKGWWGHYALVYETTPGDDGRGHVHIHIAAISSWVPYTELHAAWRRAYPGSLILDVQAPGKRKSKSAADYLSKYMTKAVDAAEFTGQLAGELLVANRNKRRVTTSELFWVELGKTCQKCGKQHECVAKPAGIQGVVPGAALRAQAERYGVWVPRGEVQPRLIE